MSRRSPWLALAACRTRGGCRRSPSRSRSGRVDANGPACSKRAEPCGKRFTGMRQQPGRAPARRSSSDRGRDVDYAAAFALALSGDLPQSRALAEGLAREFPEATFGAVHVSADAAGPVLLEHSADPAAAIQALQIASRYDLALGGVGFIGRFGGLYPIYVRGLAYLAARQPAAAAAEFQRILDHRSIVLVDPMDAMARLQLARALALSGDTVKAKSAYDDLLTLWKNADPDIPVVKEARAEYARLP